MENGGLNLYGFVRNAPPNGVDPLGRKAWEDPNAPNQFNQGPANWNPLPGGMRGDDGIRWFRATAFINVEAYADPVCVCECELQRNQGNIGEKCREYFKSESMAQHSLNGGDVFFSSQGIGEAANPTDAGDRALENGRDNLRIPPCFIEESREEDVLGVEEAPRPDLIWIFFRCRLMLHN